jgi:hypothetical protein
MYKSKKSMNRLEIMEQSKAICTQIHTAMLAYHTGLPNPFSEWHRPYVPKASVQYMVSKSTEQTFSTRVRFDSFVNPTRLIEPSYW